MNTINTLYFLILTLSTLSCNNKPARNTDAPEAEKISKKNLEIFFQYSIEPVTYNDFTVPVIELNSSYSEYSVSLYEWRESWHITDSIYYLDNTKNGIILNDKNLIYSKVNNYGKTIFEYDKNNKLIRKQHFDKSNIRGGYYDYLYNSNYSQMYEVLTNKNSLQRHDTLTFYKFDSTGRPIIITQYGKSYEISKLISYDDNGLIQSITKKIRLNESVLDKTEYAKYNYVFNKKGDWIELTIDIQDNSDNKIKLLCKRFLNG